MDSLLEALHGLSAPLATVVHIGAGGSEALWFHPPAMQRLVLVEGDPDAAAELRRSLEAGHTQVQIVEKVVAPAAGTTIWHRYNRRTLNGPLNAAALTRFYPRLREGARITQATQSLYELLSGLQLPPPSSSACNVLIFDVPGQEDALLASLGRELIQNFEWVIVRGCGEALGGPMTGIRHEELLCALGYARQTDDRDVDPMWPTVTWQLDRSRVERDTLAGRLADALEELQRSNDEWATRVEALTRERDERERSQAACEGRVGLLQTQFDEFRVRSDVQVEALVRERDEQAHWHQENATWARGLKAELETAKREAEAHAETLAAQLNEKLRMLADAEKRAGQLSLQLEAVMQRSTQQAEVLTRERDEQAHWHQENAKWAQSLKLENEHLKTELADLRTDAESLRHQLARSEEERSTLKREMMERDVRQRQLDAEILKAEAQLTLVKDVLIREKNF